MNKLIKNWKLEIRNWRLHSATLLSLVALFVGFTAFFALPSDASAAVIRRAPNNFGLVGYWSFDDARGSTATDFSGNGNAGTLTNMDASTDWVSGKRGKALDFDGSDDYVGGIDLNPQINNNITISVWVKPDSFSSSAYQGIVTEKYDPNSNDVVFELFYDGSVNKYAAGFYDGNWHKVFDSSTDTETNVWKHLTATYDGSTLKLYKNGKQMNSTNDAAGLPSGDLNWEIGRRHDRYGDPINNFNSTIDNVRIYDRALSSSEVKDLYNAGGYAKRNSTGDALYPNKLVSHWTMDGPDISGQTVKDVHSSNDGNKQDNPIENTGLIGQAMRFDGVDDYISVSDDSTLDITDAITLSAWIKPEGSGPRDVLSKGDRGSASAAYQMTIENDDVPRLQLTDSNETNYRLNAASSITMNEWHHLVGTWNGSTMKLYVDGESSNSQSFTGSINEINQLLHIGRNTYGGGPEWFDGIIDDVRVYNDGLSTDEVSRLYTATKPDTINSSQNEKLTDGLVGMWSFDGADVDLSSSTAEVRDASSNGNHGDAKNGAKPAIGRVGQAYEFDGSDDAVTVSDSSLWDFRGQPATVSIWFRAAQNQPNVYPRFFDHFTGGSPGAGWLFGLDGQSDNVRFSHRDDGTGDGVSLDSPNTYDDDTWHHAAVTLDGSAARLYIDGDQKDTDSYSDLNNFDKTLSIGRNGGNQFKGKLDNARIYHRALTDNEIQRLYSIGR